MTTLDPTPPSPPTDPERGLDPDDWGAFGTDAHALVDEVCEFLRRVDERPVWRSVPADVRERLRSPVPRTGAGTTAALDAFRRDVFPYPYGSIHPRFWGWVNGSALPIGVLGDLAASAMNSNVGAFDHSAHFVEKQVLEWMRELLSFETGSEAGDGILTSGGSQANLYGLTAALHTRGGANLRKRGLAGAPPMTVYASLETHSSITKAVELLGIGSDQLRKLPVDGDYRVDVAALARTIAADREAGYVPIAVVGNAGTVNTGATDDLDALADLCEREQLWLHVDGAFGALAWLSESRRAPLAGMQRADSIAFDLHKWMYLPSDVGCVLVRDPLALRRAFELPAPYLAQTGGGVAADGTGAFMDRGLELTRRFRALKVWLALKAHGAAEFAERIELNLRQTEYLVACIDASSALERCAPAPLNVVCFRYTAGDVPFEQLDELNRELLVRMQVSGIAVPSHTVLGGAFALRVAITNHRSRFSDFDVLVEAATRIGDELLAELRAGSPTWLNTKRNEA